MKHLILAGLLMISLPLFAQVAIAPTEGSGTTADPFQIDCFGHLYYITSVPGMWSMHYIQTADIDATESANIADPDPNSHGWIPIGSVSPFFTGSYDGKGYEISDLTLQRPSSQFCGLFGYMNAAHIQRVHLRNAAINGGNYTGILAGVVNAGSVVSHCSATGTTTGNINVGGLIGYSDDTLIMNSYSHADVQGNEQVGGFVGMAGWNSPTYVRFCYSTGTVGLNSGTYFGGFMGRGNVSYIRECYWDIDSSGVATDPAASGKTSVQMMQEATYQMWNFQNQWSIQEGAGYPNLAAIGAMDSYVELALEDLAGQGTQNDPYLLTTADELNVMRQDLGAHYKLVADIDLGSSVVWDWGRGWNPVGTIAAPFTGVLDGDGHIISKLTVNRPKSDYQGLFGYMDGASILSLNLQNAHLIGNQNCGGAAGYAMHSSLDMIGIDGKLVAERSGGGIAGVVDSGSLQRCQADAQILCYVEFGGGLVGALSSTGGLSGTITNSSSNGELSCYGNAGGIVGINNSGYILNCCSHVSVNAYSQAGGIVGYVGGSNIGYVVRCYATGPVTLSAGGTYAGGVTGRMLNGFSYECYWDVQSSGVPSDPAAAGKTTSEMMQMDTFTNWNFGTLWQIEEGISYPQLRDLSQYALPQNLLLSDLTGGGTPANPYLIQSVDELNVMRQSLNACYQLESDLDFASSVVWNGGLGWLPVGDNGVAFSGSLDGNGHQISNLNIIRPGFDNAGLFGKTAGATLTDLSLANANTHAWDNAGGFVGYALNTTLEMAGYSGCLFGHNCIGGIAGVLHGGQIQNAVTQVSILATGSFVGSVAGFVNGDAAPGATVNGCSGTGLAKGQGSVGGLIGYLAFGILSDSYTHTSIQGQQAIGGAVGRIGDANPGSVFRCYSTGFVNLDPGGYSNGGFVGYLFNGTTTSCYWNVETSGMPSSGGGSGTIGQTTAQMTYPGSLESYVGWDFTLIWSHDPDESQNAGYPYLSFQASPVPDAVQDLTISRAGNDFLLEWQPVPGVGYYRVYASEDPFQPVSQWIYLGETHMNSFTVPGGERRFLVVRSVD